MTIHSALQIDNVRREPTYTVNAIFYLKLESSVERKSLKACRGNTIPPIRQLKQDQAGDGGRCATSSTLSGRTRPASCNAFSSSSFFFAER